MGTVTLYTQNVMCLPLGNILLSQRRFLVSLYNYDYSFIVTNNYLFVRAFIELQVMPVTYMYVAVFVFCTSIPITTGHLLLHNVTVTITTCRQFLQVQCLQHGYCTAVSAV